MSPANKHILDAHEHFYTTFAKAQTINGMSHNVKRELLNVMREEFWPGYTYDEWCPHCVGKFLSDVYRKYEEWKRANIEPVKDQPPITVKATFPQNKQQ